MADASTTLETGAIQEILVDEIDEIPDMVSHLYYVRGDGVSLCGHQHFASDPHVQMHRRRGDVYDGIVSRGIRACPVCGAPLCGTCFAENV